MDPNQQHNNVTPIQLRRLNKAVTPLRVPPNLQSHKEALHLPRPPLPSPAKKPSLLQPLPLIPPLQHLTPSRTQRFSRIVHDLG